MNKYSLTKLSNLQIAMLGSIGGYLSGVANDEFKFNKKSIKSIAEQLQYMVDLASKQNEREELELSHHREQWYKRMEEACKDCFFYEKMVENEIDLPESEVAWQCAYEDYEKVLSLGESLKLTYFLEPKKPNV